MPTWGAKAVAAVGSPVLQGANRPSAARGALRWGGPQAQGRRPHAAQGAREDGGAQPAMGWPSWPGGLSQAAG
eukprot:2563704-Alexandrium_andersonii.AAC.1